MMLGARSVFCFALAALMLAGCAEPSGPQSTQPSKPIVYYNVQKEPLTYFLGAPPSVADRQSTKDEPTRTAVGSNFFLLNAGTRTVWRLKVDKATPLDGLTMSLNMELTQPGLQRTRGPTINLGDCTWRLSVNVVGRTSSTSSACVDIADPVVMPGKVKAEWNIAFPDEFTVKANETLQFSIVTGLASNDAAPTVFALTNSLAEQGVIKFEQPAPK